MLGHIGFLIAGFFFPVLPWAPAIAFVLQAFGMWTTRWKYRQWWERSHAATYQIITMQLAMATALNTILMLPGNFIMGLL